MHNPVSIQFARIPYDLMEAARNGAVRGTIPPLAVIAWYELTLMIADGRLALKDGQNEAPGRCFWVELAMTDDDDVAEQLANHTSIPAADASGLFSALERVGFARRSDETGFRVFWPDIDGHHAQQTASIPVDLLRAGRQNVNHACLPFIWYELATAATKGNPADAMGKRPFWLPVKTAEAEACVGRIYKGESHLLPDEWLGELQKRGFVLFKGQDSCLVLRPLAD